MRYSKVIVTLNLINLNKLLMDSFRGNQSEFAREVGIDRGQMSKILKDGSCAGKDFICGLYYYCKNRNLNIEDFIFLTKV